MVNRHNCLFVLLLAVCFVSSAIAQTKFETQRLQSIASALHISSQLDSISAIADCDTVISSGTAIAPLHIKSNNCDEISHIGYKIFERDSNQFVPAEICNFIERYLLELDLLPGASERQVRMAVDRVLHVGDLHDFIKPIGEADTLRYGEIKHHTHAVSIFRNGGRHSQLSFDADCQLILGADDTELEHIFAKRFRKISEQRDSSQIDFTLQLDMYNYRYDTIPCNRQDLVRTFESDGCNVIVLPKPDGTEVMLATNSVLSYVHVVSIDKDFGRLYAYIRLDDTPDEFISLFYPGHNN